MPIYNRKTIAALLLCLCVAAAGAEGERPSVALVLSGAGVRGFAHIMVLEVIEELGIPVDMIVGVSTGAVVGGLYAAGYSPAMILEAFSDMDWASFFNDRRVSPFRNRDEELPLAIGLGNRAGGLRIGPIWERGLSPGQATYDQIRSLTTKIPSHIDFDDLPTPFRAVVMETPSGRFEMLGSGDLAEAIRASLGMQGFFEPFHIDGHYYGDGAFLNNLPVREVREMGFDIVIAVDLYPPPLAYPTEPLNLPYVLGTHFFNLQKRGQHELADVVFFPLPADAPIMNFNRIGEIYALAAKERETLVALLEPVRRRVADANQGPRVCYGDMPYLTPQRISIQGALPRDRSYIERAFARLVKGRPLQAENIAAFLGRIYETGNYSTVTARTDTRGGETVLEVILRPETRNRVLFRAGLDYAGTFSSGSSSRAALRGGLEFQGRDGFSLLLGTSVMDELSIGLSVFRPLGPRFFVAAETSITGGEEPMASHPPYFRGMLKGGLRFNRHNSLAIWPEYFRFRDGDRRHAIAGVGTAYTYSGFNHTLFPSRGFRGRVDYRLRFTPDFYSFHLLGADLKAAIPLNSRFSIGASAYASTLFGETELPAGIAAFGLGNVGRRYFPHADGVFCGERRTAVSLALQFEPRENLHIMGGRLLFSLAGSAGRFGSFEWNAWDNLADDELLWNASLGAAVVPLQHMGIQLRIGAGGGGGNRPAPFMSLDVGMSGLRKRLF